MSSAAAPEPQVRRGRGRPRTPGAEQRILDAALEEYGERGWAGFTMDGVARRAGVGKSTVYLRWQDKDSLLIDAVDARTGGIEDVDTGSLRGDLIAISANLFRHYLDPAGWATLRLAVDAAASPSALGTFSRRIAEQHAAAVLAVVARAVERGEAPADLPAPALVLSLYGAVTMQRLTIPGDQQHLPDEEILRRVTELVDFVLR
ncbi:TetR/AcrR family transcriptional regulator [Nocardioides dongkuii]|uniref:TetR/AcrR family transcriptional regulator n=1 Tax=Nocardioides dongkuii TaxID=2760089 RepID=UPI0015FE6FD4|nr:TetR/AcrR family transcriptional regulator [Nocardioides dongkuii]